MSETAKLALEDGTVYTGVAFGARGEADGEVCFNTSMTGYQEILTDPSYRGQIVTMTYPEIGNYGVNDEDQESPRPQVSGFIVRNPSSIASNFRASSSLEEYLRDFNVVAWPESTPGRLVRRLRQQGAMKGVLSSVDLDDASLVAKAKASPGLVGRDLVREVVPGEARNWDESLSEWARWPIGARQTDPRRRGSACRGARFRYEVEHCSASARARLPGHGAAWNRLGCPDSRTGSQRHFLSNGPGDPEPLSYAIETIGAVLGKVPVFGICLGHQLLSLACGARTFKLKFGHRGSNQPVQNLDNGKVEITCQNHGFAVAEDDLPKSLEVTHRNLNDSTIEGVRHRELPAFSVQYHPEASAGPHDSSYLFRQFVEMMGKA